MKKKGKNMLSRTRSRIPTIKRSSFKPKNFFVFVIVFGLVGGIAIYLTHAASISVTYTGSFNKKKPSVSYAVSPTTSGTLTTSFSFTKTSSATISLIDASGATIATKTGPSPESISATVNAASYKVIVSSSSGTGNYTLTIGYPTADNTPPPDSTAPTVSILAPSAGTSVSGVVNVTGTASDNVSVSKVQVNVDGGSYQLAGGTTSWSYSLDTKSLSNGSHTINALATDSSNNAANASVIINVNNPTADTTPPTAPSNLTSTAQTTSSISLSWNASTDNVGVVQYDVYRNSTKIGSVTGNSPPTSYSDIGLGNGTSYSYYVVALDAAGNVSAPSNTLAVSTTSPDTTKPNVSISAPTSAATVAGQTAIAGTASDNAALTSVTLQIDNGAIITPSGTTSWSYNWDTTFYANGSHTITATATDTSGNTNSASITVTVNNLAAGDTTKPQMNGPLNANNPLTGTAANFSTTAADNDYTGVTRADYSMDGGPLIPIPITPGSSVNIAATMDSTKYSDGSHYLVVNAYDAAGNSGQVAGQVTVRNTAYYEDKSYPDGSHVTINTASVNQVTGAPWTADWVHTLVSGCFKTNDFAAVATASHYHIYVQDQYESVTSMAWVTTTDGVISQFSGSTYLDARAGKNFPVRPDLVACYEYGHNWNMYYMVMYHNKSYADYQKERWVTADGSVTLAQNETCLSYLDADSGCFSIDLCNLFGQSSYEAALPCFNVSYYLINAKSQPGLDAWILGPWRTDTTKPIVNITSPNGSIFGNAAASGNASDNFGIKTLTIQLDNGPQLSPTLTSDPSTPYRTTWSYPINASTTTNGTHTLTLRATDPAGNIGITTSSFTASGL
jgi:chitodextrinase